MQEIRRPLSALQKSDVEKVATPANWQPGDDVIIPPLPTQSKTQEKDLKKKRKEGTALTGSCA